MEGIGSEAVVVPSLHHRKEGWLRHQENVAQATDAEQPGWFSFDYQSENHPGLAAHWMLRDVFLIARPPLLAVMQGGDYASFEFIHTFPVCAFSND